MLYLSTAEGDFLRLSSPWTIHGLSKGFATLKSHISLSIISLYGNTSTNFGILLSSIAFLELSSKLIPNLF